MSSSALVRLRRSIGLIVAMVALVAGLITASPHRRPTRVRTAASPSPGPTRSTRSSRTGPGEAADHGHQELLAAVVAQRQAHRLHQRGERTASANIWVMNADGIEQEAGHHLGDVQPPSWSPDGTKLAFGGGGTTTQGGKLLIVKSTAPFGAPVEQLLGSPPGRRDRRRCTWLRGTTGVVAERSGHLLLHDVVPEQPRLLHREVQHRHQELRSWIRAVASCCGEGMAVSAGRSRPTGRGSATPPRPTHRGSTCRSHPTAPWTTPFATQAQDEQLAFSPNGKRSRS